MGRGGADLVTDISIGQSPSPKPSPRLRCGARELEPSIGHSDKGFTLEMYIRRLGVVPQTTATVALKLSGHDFYMSNYLSI